MLNQQTKSILRYTFLPELVPRFRELFITGFQYIPFFIAFVYQLARLLPDNHPYLKTENFGKYGIRHVIAEASNNLIISKNNIDQILVYLMILTGLVMAVMQIGVLVFSMAIGPAMAQASVFGIDSYFSLKGGPMADDGAHDIALMMLDLVFGVPDLFNSCISKANIPCRSLTGTPITHGMNVQLVDTMQFPNAAQQGLHELFRFYNTGLLVIAVLITTYFIITIVAETAQTGTPFGKRFNKVWAPLRLILAFGLLVPFGGYVTSTGGGNTETKSTGMNAAQYIVLYAAKFGSNFASNGWNLFAEQVFSGAGGGSFDPERIDGLAVGQKFITAPNAPRANGLLQFLYSARVCAEAYEKTRRAMTPPGPELKIYVVAGGGGPTSSSSYALDNITSAGTANREGDTVNPADFQSGSNSYEEMIAFAKGAKYVTLRFGHEPPTGQSANSDYVDGIKPLCGELAFNLLDTRLPSTATQDSSGNAIGADAARQEIGVEIMQRTYWAIIQHAWFNEFYRSLDLSTNSGPGDSGHPYALYEYCTAKGWNECGNITKSGDESFPRPTPEHMTNLVTFYQAILHNALFDTYGLNGKGSTLPFSVDGEFDLSDIDVVADYPDGAVSAQGKVLTEEHYQELINKGWAAAAIWYDKIAKMNGSLATALYNMPTVVQYPMIMEEVADKKLSLDNNRPFRTRFEPVGKGGELKLTGDPDESKAQAEAMWRAYELWNNTQDAVYSAGNPIENFINMLFGTEGLFNLKENPDVHPLAQLSAVGRSLIQATVVNLLGGVAAPVFLVMADQQDLAKATMGLFTSVAGMTLTIGFVLYYVVPFLPFIYFFFALGGWVKGIFEAMVGAPLWALAHIRIDGNGLPGQAAISGYFLIFEIFLRPILIVFGLLASVLIFSAMVNVLNDVWDIAVSNVAGGKSPDQSALSQAASTMLGNTSGQSLGDWARSPIDKFFYTVMYAVVVYMMGMSSFKLIDLIPNNILRWMGQSVQTFNDSREDAAQSLVSQSYVGGQQAISGVTGGLSQAGQKAIDGTRN